MNNLVKIILVLIVISLVPFAFIKKNTQSDIKEIEFWTLQLSGFSEYIEKIISNYEKENPGVKIKWVDVPFSEGEKRLLAASLSNKVPDLVNMNPDFSSTLAERKALTDIRKIIPVEEYNNYISPAWQRVSNEKSIYGIPWYITSAVTFYNTNIFKEAGINSIKIPETYSGLGQIAEEINENTDKYLMMPNLTESGKLIKLFNLYEIPIVNEQKTEALFNTKEARKILKMWTKFYEKGYIPKESITETHRASLEKFQSGETAFIVAGANFIKIIKENAPQVYKVMNVSKQLTGYSQKYDFSLMNLVIPKKSRHPEEALKFALFLTNEKHQLEFSKLAPVLPSNKKALSSDFFKKFDENDLISKARVISAAQLENAIPPIPSLKNKKDLLEIINNAAQEALLMKKSPEDALKDAAQNWSSILKENY